MKSNISRKVQDSLVSTSLYRLFIPFQGISSKLYHLTNFALWKNKQKVELGGFTDRFELYGLLIDKEKLSDIQYLEFGVSKGESLRWWLSKIKNPKTQFFGFDTFEGIPEDWGNKKKGSYTNDGNIPEMNDRRCKFYVGFFQETMGTFLKENNLDKRIVLHLDADLYSSTLYCLFSLGPFLKKDDILIFDEFDITTHEYRAFTDFASAQHDFSYTVIGESNNFNKVVIKIN